MTKQSQNNLKKQDQEILMSKEAKYFEYTTKDVNGLKLINDILGHLEGDKMLVDISNIWWDGKSYPLGLKGEEIPIISRIINIVDSHDVMTNNKTYKKTISNEEAIKELELNSGTQLDSKIVKIFINYLKNKK